MDFDLTTNKGQSEALMWCAAQCTNDPLKFAQIAFPWGKGTLANFTGPDKWQAEVLTSMRDRLQSGEAWQHVIQDATASGHGTGKSCLVSWIILWALCTYPDTRCRSSPGKRGMSRLGAWMLSRGLRRGQRALQACTMRASASSSSSTRHRLSLIPFGRLLRAR